MHNKSILFALFHLVVGVSATLYPHRIAHLIFIIIAVVVCVREVTLSSSTQDEGRQDANISSHLGCSNTAGNFTIQ